MSRANPPQAPLFFSATDEFREEDDEEEREKEVADFYALQRSRRQFGGSRLDESEEADDDGSRGSGLENSGDRRKKDDREPTGGGGIKSSWKGGKTSTRNPGRPVGVVDEGGESIVERRSSESSGGRGKMVDIQLESTIRSSMEELDRDDPPDNLAVEAPSDTESPPMQRLRKGLESRFTNSPFIPQETGGEALRERPQPPDSESSSVPASAPQLVIEPPRHDVFWGNLYLISLASLFASFFVVWLNTYKPSVPLGDTIYTTLHKSFHLLSIDTLVAVIVSLLWLALLRSYVRPLVFTILVAVPTILIAFSLYPLISSYKVSSKEAGVQDKVMRWLSFIPGILAVLWTFTVYKGRHSLGKAISILEFGCRILAANPALLMVGFATLGGVVAWTWLWMGMFTRVFLGGHFLTGKSYFIIDVSTWWLGMFFVLVYLWTIAVGAGIQRATTAATVSQWYFHRLAVPAPTSHQVVKAAFTHSTTTLFGTICLSTLLSLLIRLPLIVLPRRLTAILGLCTYTLLPNSVTVFTHPLTLTYSAIHSQPLVISSRMVSQMSFISPSNPATATRYNHRAQSSSSSSSILPYNLSLLLLHATRLMTSFAMGFGAWVSTARNLTMQSSGDDSVKGSLYAYVVGLIAAAIGWGVLGTMEGVLTGVVDAVAVCWGSEMSRGEVRYCREAGWLFGEDNAGTDEEERLMGR